MWFAFYTSICFCFLMIFIWDFMFWLKVLYWLAVLSFWFWLPAVCELLKLCLTRWLDCRVFDSYLDAMYWYYLCLLTGELLLVTVIGLISWFLCSANEFKFLLLVFGELAKLFDTVWVPLDWLLVCIFICLEFSTIEGGRFWIAGFWAEINATFLAEKFWEVSGLSLPKLSFCFLWILF